MSKMLSGSELAGYIKERQAKQVRNLRQSHQVFPKLAIIKSTSASLVIDTYIRMKQQYGDDILIETIIETLNEVDMPAAIKRLNEEERIDTIAKLIAGEEVTESARSSAVELLRK